LHLKLATLSGMTFLLMTNLTDRPNTIFFIRQADINDLHDIVRIFEIGAIQSLGFTIEESDLYGYFQNHLISQNDTFKIWVAVYGDKVIGWQSILPTRVNPFVRPFFGESSTYVEPSGIKGVATALLKHAMQECSKSQLQYIIGYVSATNAAAKHIVEKLGWELAGDLRGTSKNFETSNLHFYVFNL